MADAKIPPLVLGKGSPKPASVSPGVIRGHICLVGEVAPTASVVSDIAGWAAELGAGTVVVDLHGQLAALLVEQADRGALGNVDVRLLTPSSPVGIPVAFKPLSGLSDATHTEPWKRLRGWLPQLFASLAGAGPGTPDHETVAAFFLRLLDDTKANNPSVLTVQGLVEAVRASLSGGETPLTPEMAQELDVELTALADDLRNAALSYGAPIDLRRLLETPVGCMEDDGTTERRHIDVVLLSHMSSVADRNSIITALLIEAFAWCRLQGQRGRLLVVLPEVESPAAFLEARPFAQRLARRVLAASRGTGLLALVVPSSFADPEGLPRFGAILIERARFDPDHERIERMLARQGMDQSAWTRLSMLQTNEWALAAGAGWAKWHRFTPHPSSVTERELDGEAVARILTPEVRDAFRYKPEPEPECEVGEGEGEPDQAAVEAKEAARAAQAVEDAEDLLSYTTKKRAKRGDSRIHQEVQELLKRKLEEKERAKEAQRFELSEIDLVEGEEPTAEEVAAHGPRPLSEGMIDDRRERGTEAVAPGNELHADDLQLELALLEAREAEEGRRDLEGPGPDVVVDLEGSEAGWESITTEMALGADKDLGEKPKRVEGEEGEEEEIIVELDEEN